MLLAHRATLIQCIREYLGIIRPHLHGVMCLFYGQCGYNEHDILEWIIAEELELIYGIFARNHEHNHFPYDRIHSQLDFALPTRLSVLTSAYIKAPQLYSDNNIVDIEVTEFDLFIKYYTNQTKFKIRG